MAQKLDTVIGLGPLPPALLVAATLFAIVIYRICFHPLSSYPGQLLGKISSWPNWYYASSGSRHLEVFRQHLKYGSVIRFGPNDISINSAAALLDIYGSRQANIIKSDWYHTIQTAEKGTNTLTVTDRTQHAQKKRLLSQAFSENALHDMEPHILEQIRKWCAYLGERTAKSEWTEGKNMSTWSDYLTFDILSDLCFGKTLGVLDREENRFVIPLVSNSTKAAYDVGYLPLKFLRKIVFDSPLAPIFGAKIIRDQIRLQSFCQKALAERREAQNSLGYDQQQQPAEARRDFFYHLFLGKDPDTGRGYSNDDLLSESLLLVIAGSHTSSSCLAACCFYLARNPRALERLTAEIRSAFPTREAIRAGAVTEAKLPYLRAVIDETLRMAPPVPAHIPREVLPGGAVIDGTYFPGGTVVGVSPYALHHNEEYFRDPFTFLPERWITADGISADSVALARSAFCPFIIGVRACIGKNMAYLELSLALAYLLWTYDIRAKAGDRTGEGGVGRGWGREREGEYQLFDCFAVKRDGPVIELREKLS